MGDTKREAERIGVAFGKIFDPVGQPVRRCYSLFSWADAQGKGGVFLKAFTDMAWAEGTDVGSDDGLRKVCERAGLDWDAAQEQVDNTDWESWAEANRLQMMASDLWGVPSYRLLDENGKNCFLLGARPHLAAGL